jgi:hypothetical protein
MSDFQRKQKMISLRLSDAEYTILKSHYRTHGARSISDLARLALHQIMDPAPAAGHDDLAVRLAQIEDRLHTLETEVSILLERELARS